MLEYVALGILIFVGITLFYGVIVIHDIPYEIAKKRNHPQQDALHVAGWISLFTLHILWPFLWIWATLYRADRGWGFSENPSSDAAKQVESKTEPETKVQLLELQNRVAVLETALQESLIKSENSDDFDEDTSKLFADLDKLHDAEQQGEK